MNEFERMMLQEGVRPLGTAPINSPARTQPPASGGTGSERTDAPSAVSGPAWNTGAAARRTRESAIAMAAEDRRNGAPTWITGLRQDGRAYQMRSDAGLAEIISAADREDLRLITIAGRDWTCVMHPGMGIATIEHDAQ